MADPKISILRTLVFEGGYQCDKDDNGNWTSGKAGSGALIGTRWGISAEVLASYLKRQPTVDDMKNLSKDTAIEIYESSWAAPLRLSEINSQEIANELYDSAVNMGVGTAIKLACQAAGLPESTHMTDEIINALNDKT